MDEDDSENVDESTENEENLQAWCLLEESENEQWQEVLKAKQAKVEGGQSSVTVERREQSQFESEEDCGGERQVGKGQSHHGLWSRGPCDA